MSNKLDTVKLLEDLDNKIEELKELRSKINSGELDVDEEEIETD